MSARATALLAAVTLFAVNGCVLIAIEYAPLPTSWGAFLLSLAVLAVLWWATLILGIAILLVLAVYEVAHALAGHSYGAHRGPR
jgi:hypothetical protein